MAHDDRPVASDVAALQRMRLQKQAGTKPELALRRELWARGLRYRVGFRLPIPASRRTADVAFPKQRVSVFVDGCYWHACPDHGTRPRSNSGWWADKLAANVARDRDTDQQLRLLGWTPVRVWEHEEPREAAVRIYELLPKRQT